MFCHGVTMNLSAAQNIFTDTPCLMSTYLFNRDLYGAYYSPGTVLSALQILTQLIS